MKQRMYAWQRGVSLIEAVVAMAVMAFGMLALVGVQATLRNSGDVGRQRTEAVRIAQETMENYRAYAALSGTADVLDFNEIVPTARTAVDVSGTALQARLNTVFYRTITAPTVGNTAPIKFVTVTVDWTDRGGQFQSVELRSVISGLPPELAGSLVLPPARDATTGPLGRNRAIPLLAKSLPGTGTSVFKPPQAGGGTVAWVFNNVTGLITGVCTVSTASTTTSLTAGDLTSCTTTSGQLLSGYVRFAGGAATLAEAESPTGTSLNLDVVLTLTSTAPSAPVCFDDSTDNASLAATKLQVAYYCMIPRVVPPSDASLVGRWAGRARIAPLAFTSASNWTIAASGAANYKVCRYTILATDTGTSNFSHPLDYTLNGSPPDAGLTNQNFLVISAADSCPTETPAAGDFFNANTRLHQDGSSTYNNP